MNKVKPTAKKVAANKQNAQKSTGPINTTSTRFNARKHGLVSKGVTELDEPQRFQSFLADLKKELEPVGILAGECIDQIAALTMRIRRARRLEAEAFTAHLNPAHIVHHAGTLTALDPDAFGRDEIVDAGLPAQVSMDVVDQINRTILRYESDAERKLSRWLNQLERLQRAQRGETVPAPVALDVNVHHERSDLASFGNVRE